MRTRRPGRAEQLGLGLPGARLLTLCTLCAAPNAGLFQQVAELRKKEDKLRTKEEQLRTEKEQLRTEKDKLLTKELLLLERLGALRWLQITHLDN